MSVKRIPKGTDTPPIQGQDILKFSNERQIKTRQALIDLDQDFGHRLSNIYEGIIIALNGNNPEKISIVSHLARELSAILPMYVSELPIKQKPLSLAKAKHDLRQILVFLEDKSESDEKIKEIVDDLLSKIPEQSSQREQLGEVVDQHPLLGARPTYLNKQFVKQWMGVHQYFVKNSHHHELRNQRASKLTEVELLANWDTFDNLIYRVLVKEPFYDAIQELDKLLQVKNPKEQNADELMRHVVEPEHRKYFFEKCDNPNWLDLLDEREAFSVPQATLKHDGYIQFIIWPESKYLAKIAGKSSEKVFEIISRLTTDNQTILYDFIQAALKSSKDTSFKYVPLIIEKKWLKGPYNMSLPAESVKLVQKLVQDGKEEHAISLTNELLDLRVDQPVNSEEEQNPYIRLEAKPYFDEWQFGEIVHKNISELVTSNPVELFSIFVSKLKSAIEFEGREGDEDTLHDYSHIWRPNLSEPRHSREDAKNILLDGIIGILKQHQDDTLKLKEFAEILQQHPYALFRRIEMYLYQLSSSPLVSDAEKILNNKTNIIAYNLRREYLPLLSSLYEKISPEAQGEILEVINQGPDFTQHEDCSDEQFERIIANWNILYLSQIKEHLPNEQSKEYSALVEKYGEAVDDSGELQTWDGGKSPISQDDLKKFNPEDTLEYLAAYKSPEDPFGRHSTGGLGLAFADIIEENPEPYVKVTSLFFEKKIRPIYFYSFIQGLREAIRKEHCFEWENIINLCHKIIVEKQHFSEPLSSNEQDWKSVRRATADFFGIALGGTKCQIPITLKEKVWDIIADLAEDPNPTPEDEKNDGVNNIDPVTLAINTVRGEAINAAVNYGLWVARNLDEKPEVKTTPELDDLLNRHLDLDQDPSPAIRSVYGSRVPNFFYLNKPWLEANKDKIFDASNPELLWAAWEGYLANSVIKEVFEVLKDQYFEFIKHLGSIEKNGYRAADADQRFSQHIAIICANEPEHYDLVETFFKNARTKERSSSINFVGRVILREIETFEDKESVKQRLGALWDQRISLSKDQCDTEELQEFGWWFKYSPFPQKETLDRTIKTLELTEGIIDVPYEITEELKLYATEHPLESIIILDLIVHAEKETYDHLYKLEEYREVIKLVKETQNDKAKKIAEDVVHYLGSIGLIEEFRDLL